MTINKRAFIHHLGRNTGLFIILLSVMVLLWALERESREAILENTQRDRLAIIHSVLPDDVEGDIFAGQFEIAGHPYLGLADSISVFRIMQQGKQTGVVFSPIITLGYKGTIELIVGVMRDGHIAGVNTVYHTESKGLGDGIEQAVSDWIFAFDDRSLANTPAAQWAIRREGGQFDQLSGATITSGAVIRILHKVLRYHTLYQAALYY